MYEIRNSVFANEKTWLTMEKHIGTIPDNQGFLFNMEIIQSRYILVDAPVFRNVLNFIYIKSTSQSNFIVNIYYVRPKNI